MPSLSGQVRTTLLTDRRNLVLLGSCGLFLQLAGLGIPACTIWAIDGAVGQGDGGVLTIVGLGLIAIAAFRAFLEWFKARLQLFLESRIDVAFSVCFFKHLMRIPFLAVQKRSYGDLSIAVSALDETTAFSIHVVIGLSLDLASAMFQLALLAVLFPSGAILVALASMILFLMANAAGRRLGAIQEAVLSAQREETTNLADVIHGVRILKAAGLEASAHRQWAISLKNWLSFSAKEQWLQVIYKLIGTTVQQGMTAWLLIWGTAMVLEGKLGMGVFLAALQLASGVLMASRDLASARLEALRLRPTAARAENILAIEAAPEVRQESGEPGTNGTVIAEDVWFRYRPEGPWVLKGFSLHASKGEQVEIPGASGAGKSTALRLLAGLMKPERGQALIGGRAPEAARQDFILLPQFTQLLNGSIRRNIEIFSGGAKMDRIAMAASETGLKSLLDSLPMGWDTILAAGGTNLSGGQRQLILLAACLASERSILLLDEAFANLDWNLRETIGRSPLLKSKTIVFASHDGRPLVA